MAQDEAADFVTNLMLADEAVGKISAVPSFARKPRDDDSESVQSGQSGAERRLDSLLSDELFEGGDEEEKAQSPTKARKLSSGKRAAPVASGGRKSAGKSKPAAAKRSSRRSHSSAVASIAEEDEEALQDFEDEADLERLLLDDQEGEEQEDYEE